MQIYAIKLKNFCRFSDKKNSVVFDILPEYKDSNGEVDIDELYEKIKKNPLEHIRKVKEQGITNFSTICGFKNGSYSFSNGTGKCFGRNTSILMYDGTTKKSQDIKIGDIVMGNDSTPRRVLSTHSGCSKLYEVSLSKGDTFVVNEEHILVLKLAGIAKHVSASCYKKHCDKDGLIKMSVKDFLAMSEHFRNLCVSFKTGVEYSNNKLLLVDPYFLGVWLGDGSSCGPHITSADPEVVDMVGDMASKYDLHIGIAEKRGQKNKAKTYRIAGSKGKSNALTTDMSFYGLINNKHIPIDYKTSSRKARLELLAGLLDSDGYTVGSGMGFSNKNEVLANDVVYLSRSLGFATTIKTVYKHAQNKVEGLYYQVSIWGDMSCVPFRIKRKIPRHRIINKNPLNFGISIKQVNDGEYFGFETDGNHLFLLGDFTVVHNSTILEGIVYCLFEQVVKHTKNNDKTEKVTTAIITKINGSYPKDVTEAYVEMIFEENGKVYILKRGRELSKNKQSHTKLLKFDCMNEDNELDSHSGHRTMDTEESLAKVINISYDLFVNSVLFGQMDMGKFLSGTDQTRKEMLIELLRFDSLLNGMLEKTRVKKNLKQAEVDKCNAQIMLMNENLQKRTPIDTLNAQIAECERVIGDCILTEEKLRKELNNLNKSDIIKELEAIKLEGSKVKNDLNAKKKDKDSRVNEWDNLSADVAKSISSKFLEIASANNKKAATANKFVSMEQYIESFNMDAKKKDLEMVAKAKIAKPKYDAKIKELLDAKEKTYGDINTLESDIRKLFKEITLLTEQIKSGDEQFKCDKCKSLVSRKHIENEIAKNEKDKATAESELAKNKEIQDKYVKDLQEARDRMLKIDVWLAKESQVNSEIKDFENNKEKVKELKANIKENVALIVKLEQEKKDLEDKKAQYTVKVAEIGKACDAEINAFEDKLKELTAKYKAVENSATSIKDQMSRIQMTLDEKSKSKSMSNSQIGSLKKEIEVIGEDNRKLLDLRSKFEADSVVLRRLETLDTCLGLGGIQIRIIKKYLPLLNVYIEEFMKVLSGGTMGVKIDIDEKGKVVVVVTGDSADNYEMSSGGEETIVKLAVSVGMALLSFTRCNQKPEFIGIDEVFASLDSSHTEMAFRLLEKLKEKFARIIIISHNPLINDKITNKIIVEKDEGMFGRSRIKAVV